MNSYEILEHTADICIRVKGKDLEGLFKNTALAMFELIADKARASKPSEIKKFIIKQEAGNIKELFINWLNELLSLSATKEKIFCGFIFKRLNENHLEAIASGCPVKNYKINTEIKAATYHELKIEKILSGWQAEVIFDV